jgi:hypothetical protein
MYQAIVTKIQADGEKTVRKFISAIRHVEPDVSFEDEG